MRKAVRVLLHSSIHVKGIGELGVVVPPESKNLDNLEMQYGPEGVIVDCSYKGLKVSFAIPGGNIKMAQLVPVEEPKTVKPKTP